MYNITVIRYTVRNGLFIPTVIELHAVTSEGAKNALASHLCTFYRLDVSIRIKCNQQTIKEYDPLALFALSQVERYA